MQLKPNEFKCDGRGTRFAPRFRPFFTMWIKVLDLLVRVLTFGSARVVSVDNKSGFIKWDGVIR